jgi:hypothetical protein
MKESKIAKLKELGFDETHDAGICVVPECLACGVILCPSDEPLHCDKDGCPVCSREQRYGVVYFDPKGGTDGDGCFDWAFCKNVTLQEAESIALSWDRITGEDRHRIYSVGVAPWHTNGELTTKDMAAALAWAENLLRWRDQRSEAAPEDAFVQWHDEIQADHCLGADVPKHAKWRPASVK